MHILLGDAITPLLNDAAEQMLVDFYLLIPELYGDSACTHNVHLLISLPNYVYLCRFIVLLDLRVTTVT